MLEEIFKRALRAVFGGGSNISAANPLQVWDPKVGSLISYTGTTTADGAPLGASLIDALLAAQPDFDGCLVIITSGACAGQARDINGITTGGTVTPSIHFGSPTGVGVQIVAGTSFVIAGITTTPAEVAAIEAKLDGVSGLAAIKAVVDAILVDTGTTLETKLDNIKTVVDAILVDTGTTLEGKLDAIGIIVTAILVDTGTTLEGKLDALALICTAARGLLIDRLSLLAAGGAGELTAARAAFLDNINQAGLLQVTAARAALLDQITALRLAELDAANIPADVDTLKTYNDPKVMGRLQIKATTIDLNQAAATYDLFTATTQDVVVEKLVLRMPNSALAAPFTYLTIQTDDTTPIVLIDATAGAVGNLTAEAQLAWTGAILLDAGTGAKIRLTIAVAFGGAATVADVIAECRAVVAGGYLA